MFLKHFITRLLFSKVCRNILFLQKQKKEKQKKNRKKGKKEQKKENPNLKTVFAFSWFKSKL